MTPTILVLLLAGAGGTGRQTPAPMAPDLAGQHSTARILLRLENDWATALVRRDRAFFQRVLADGFVYTEDDRISTRHATLQDLVGGTDTVENARNDDMRVHTFGGTAVVTGWLLVRGHGASGPFDRHYRFTDTWIRRAGRWQIIAAHDYLVAPRAR